MTNRRRVCWLFLLIALLAAGIGAAVPFLISRLPDPAIANREELLQWMVTRDLAQESREIRLAWGRRLEQEFSKDVDWDLLNKQTTEAQRTQLWKNIPLLFGPWLSEKAATYAQLSHEQQQKFMDGILDTISAWRGADRLQPKPRNDTRSGAPRGLLAALLEQVEAYKRSAEPLEREKNSQFLLALQLRALTR